MSTLWLSSPFALYVHQLFDTCWLWRAKSPNYCPIALIRREVQNRGEYRKFAKSYQLSPTAMSAILRDNVRIIPQPLDFVSCLHTLTVRSAFNYKENHFLVFTNLFFFHKSLQHTQFLSSNSSLSPTSLTLTLFSLSSARLHVWHDDGELVWSSTRSNGGAAADTESSLLSPTVSSGIYYMHITPQARIRFRNRILDFYG